jgi:hypothetical protein
VPRFIIRKLISRRGTDSKSTFTKVLVWDAKHGCECMYVKGTRLWRRYTLTSDGKHGWTDELLHPPRRHMSTKGVVTLYRERDGKYVPCSDNGEAWVELTDLVEAWLLLTTAGVPYEDGRY